MGGNALTVYTRRYNKDEYHKLLDEVQDILNNEGIIFKVPTYFNNKETFGDLDIIIKSSTIKGNIIDVINNLFKPNEIHNNSNVKSFDFKEFQIDFILTSDDNWETSINYFSYNDLGNFIGKISYHMGFKFGHFGLKIVYRNENGGRKFSKIISKNPKKIYEFLGFDYNRYLQGFDNVEDIFKFVITSKYFNSTIFDYDKLNHINRTRNRKRQNYGLFLEYINLNTLPFNYQYKSKEFYIEKAEQFFNISLFTEINKWKQLINDQKIANIKFNGNYIMNNTSLSGKELGAAMKKFNEYIDNNNLNRISFILQNNVNDIFKIFKKINNL